MVTPENTQHCPNFTGFLVAQYCWRISIEPDHFVGSVPPE